MSVHPDDDVDFPRRTDSGSERLTAPTKDAMTAEAERIIGAACNETSHDDPGSLFCSECGRDAVTEIAADLRAAEQAGMRKAADIVEEEAAEVQQCADTYDPGDPGGPRQYLTAEAGHYRRIAAALRKRAAELEEQ